MASQRYYERGVGSRTGMRPAAIPADPSAMRAQMESLFHPRAPQAHPGPSSTSAMDTAPPSDSPSAAIGRSAERRRRQAARESPESAGDQPDGDPTSGGEPDEPEMPSLDDVPGELSPAPHAARPRARNAPAERPASLFAAGASAAPRRRKPQPGNYSWLAEDDEEDTHDDDDEQVASSLGPAPGPAPSVHARPRPRAAKPAAASPAAATRRTLRAAPDAADGSDEPSPPPKRKAPPREPAPAPAKRAKQTAPPKPKAAAAAAASPRRRGGRQQKHVPSFSPRSDPEPEPEPEPESPSDEEAPPSKRPGRPPKKKAAASKPGPKKAGASKARPGAASGTGNARARQVAISQPRGVEERVSPPLRDASAEAEGLRRGTRHRIKPLEWWRGERAEYGRPSLSRDDAPGVPGPTLRKVYRVNRAEGEGTFSGLHFKKGRKGRAPARRVAGPRTRDAHAGRTGTVPRDGDQDLGADDDDDGYVELDPTADNVAVEDGMDETTERVQLVWDPDLNQEVERTIACTSMQMDPRVLEGQTYGFEKLLSADDTLAAGMLSVPVGGSKPTKSSKDNNYVFVVIQGAALIKVGRSEFTIAPGGMFLVPRGNAYSIENAAQRELRLFFTQSRNPHGAAMALRASVQPRRATATPGPPGPPARLPHLGPRMSNSSVSGQMATPAAGPRRR